MDSAIDVFQKVRYADKDRYPQIPSTVWWGVRSFLQRAPNATVDERYLAAQLGVQEAAARQYIAELKNVGLLTEEGKATPLAQKWRLDDKYGEAVRELVAANYPENLIHADRDRQTIVRWFMTAGLGQGAAGNKAATYLLISSPTPNEAPSRTSSQASKDDSGSGARKRRTDERTRRAATVRRTGGLPAKGGGLNESHESAPQPEAFPLHVNVQIHISADAGSEQIESIFSAMRRYLYDKPSA